MSDNNITPDELIVPKPDPSPKAGMFTAWVGAQIDHEHTVAVALCTALEQMKCPRGPTYAGDTCGCIRCRTLDAVNKSGWMP